MNRLRSVTPDLIILVALSLIVIGLTQLPAPWGAVLAPIAVGVTLLLVVVPGGE